MGAPKVKKAAEAVAAKPKQVAQKAEATTTKKAAKPASEIAAPKVEAAAQAKIAKVLKAAVKAKSAEAPPSTKGVVASKKRAIEVSDKAAKSENTEAAAKKVKAAITSGTTASRKASDIERPKSTKKRSADEAEQSKKEAANLSTHPTKARFALASAALLNHIADRKQNAKKTKLSLPGVSKEADTVFLQIGLRNMPEQALKTFKGRPIPLPHPFRDIEDCSVCLLVKDKEEAKKWLGDDYQKHGIKKILSLHQLRTQYKEYSSRRELVSLYDAFVADDRIVCMLPKALGKIFYVGSKRPLPIRLAVKDKLHGDVTEKIKKALGSAFFYLSGVSTSVRIGTTDQSAEQLAENAEAVLNGAVEHIPGKWKGVQSVFLKSEKSPALPMYEALRPEETDA